MKIKIDFDTGQFKARIENFTEYSLSPTKAVCVADYECGDGSITFLRHGMEYELVGIHKNRIRARIHARIVSADAHGQEGDRPSGGDS